jgi:hypothetical protein
MPDYSTVTSRAATYHTRISQVQLAGADTAVTFESTQGGEVLGREELSAIVEDMGGAPLREAVAVLPDGGYVKIDFPKETASGPGNVTLLLRPLMRFALPLLSDFSRDDLAGLRRILQGDAQEELYPDLPGYGIEN